MKTKLLISIFAICAALLSLNVFAQNQNSPIIFPLEQVKHGMTGYGISNLGSDVPNTFKFRVSSIQKNARGYGYDLIWAILYNNPKLKKSGIISGMSGSPCYSQDGRFVGTVSYGFSDSIEAKAGITPAKDVLSVDDSLLIQSSTGSGQANQDQDFNIIKDAKTIFNLCDGFKKSLNFRTIPLVFVDSVTSNSKVPNEFDFEVVNKNLQPGDDIGVGLVIGDYTFASIGTVSAVVGKDVWIFGHYMFQLGNVNFPMLAAKTDDATLLRTTSFKEASVGEVIGTFTQDRLSAVYGHLGKKPDLIPIAVKLDRNGKKETLHLFMVRQKQLVHYLIKNIIARLLTEFSDEQNLTISSKGEVKIKDDSAQNLYFSTYGDELITRVSTYYAREFDYIANMISKKGSDKDQPARIESVFINLSVYEGDQTFNVEDVKVNNPIDSTESYSLDITLQNGNESKVVNYPLIVPQNFNGKIEVFVGDYNSLDNYKNKTACTSSDLNSRKGSLFIYVVYKNLSDEFSLPTQLENHMETYEIVLNNGVVARGFAILSIDVCNIK